MFPPPRRQAPRAHGPKSEVVGAHDSAGAAFFHYWGGRCRGRVSDVRCAPRPRADSPCRDRPACRAERSGLALPAHPSGVLAGPSRTATRSSAAITWRSGPLRDPRRRRGTPCRTKTRPARAPESPASAGSSPGTACSSGTARELFGRGLSTLGPPARLEMPLSTSGYTQFLVPGVLAQGVVVAGLFGMGYAMVRYRQSRFLWKFPPRLRSRRAFSVVPRRSSRAWCW